MPSNIFRKSEIFLNYRKNVELLGKFLKAPMKKVKRESKALENIQEVRAFKNSRYPGVLVSFKGKRELSKN